MPSPHRRTFRTGIDSLGLADANPPLSACKGGPLVARLAEQLGSCALRLAAGEPHLEAMQRLLRELQEKTAVADLAFDTRDAAWDSKSHYDFKVEKLKKHPARSGMSFTMEDRVLRNKQKQKESSAAFEKASAEAARAADTVLETRWCSTASALSELCRCHASIFERAEVSRLADRFAEAPRLLSMSSSAVFLTSEEIRSV
ncbi:unnamed protein product [Polarella glacialis]|uniref:Uncharacterized protein n=1 Tax=Polarella glacialis TaxID=89957 RepID=A0A813HXV1_POLGL|nr:unnamed protein product [Polarella glacialis]